MRVRTLSLALLLTCPTVLADEIKHEFDKQAPFASFKTYTFKPGRNTVSTNREQMDSFVSVRQLECSWPAVPLRLWNSVWFEQCVVLGGQERLLLEMVNAGTNQLAWRAICSGLIKHLSEPEEHKKRIDEVVRKAFRNPTIVWDGVVPGYMATDHFPFNRKVNTIQNLDRGGYAVPTKLGLSVDLQGRLQFEF